MDINGEGLERVAGELRTNTTGGVAVAGLVNVAGVLQDVMRLLKMPMDMQRQVWEVNYFGAERCIQAFAPLMIDGVLYATAGLPRNVVAIDAVTGETLWMWRAAEDPARFENAPFALVQNGQRVFQRIPAVLRLFFLDEAAFLRVGIIDKPILPFAAFAFLTDGRIE